MSSKQEHLIQAMGFWMFGFLSVVLAVLKLTVAGYWSWWRVMLPFLGHNAVYLLAGFLCFCWLKHEEGEEGPTTVQKHSREGYNLAALYFSSCFWTTCCDASKDEAGKGSGRVGEIRGGGPVWVGMLSLVAQLAYWSRIVSGLNQEHA